MPKFLILLRWWKRQRLEPAEQNTQGSYEQGRPFPFGWDIENMKLHELRPDEGATRNRKRIGRGTGSGRGKTAGRGTKGQNARSGGGVRQGFEGGQLTFIRRLPKMRGFVNRFKVTYTPVNLDNMGERFEADAQVTPASLFDTGLLGDSKQPVVVLARGEIDKALHLQVHRISKSAREKVEAAGGSVEILPFAVNKNLPRS